MRKMHHNKQLKNELHRKSFTIFLYTIDSSCRKTWGCMQKTNLVDLSSSTGKKKKTLNSCRKSFLWNHEKITLFSSWENIRTKHLFNRSMHKLCSHLVGAQLHPFFLSKHIQSNQHSHCIYLFSH